MVHSPVTVIPQIFVLFYIAFNCLFMVFSLTKSRLTLTYGIFPLV